jgi:organic hydroperoxide reductase OsmC/OhrA
MAKYKPKTYTYTTELVWQQEKKGVLSCEGKPSLDIATPPEFRGHPGIWSPEDLFVASVNSCIMTTFLFYAEKKNIGLLNFKSKAEGSLEFKEKGFIFTEIKVFPQITVKSGEMIETARECIESSERNCLISNSIKTHITIIPEITALASPTT